MYFNYRHYYIILERDACNPNPCQHNGICKEDGGKASCECVGAWRGSYCKG